MFLVGYHPTEGYKLFDMKSNKIVISRDVVVDEIRLFDSKKKTISFQEIDLLDEGVIDGSGTDCLKLDRVCRGSKSRHRLLFSPNGKDKSTEKFLLRDCSRFGR